MESFPFFSIFLIRLGIIIRFVEVVDERLTGEMVLDEALKMMKVSERMSVGTWIDLMSGTICFLFTPFFPSSWLSFWQARRGT
jgi:hypothetical protein